MSLRFWGNSKSLATNDLAWFENSVHGGVVILGIFRDAIAMSPSLYVKQIAEKTLSIIKAIAIAAIGDTGSLRINLQKLGEATAAVTATILQSYLESENRDGWPGSELQVILEDLIQTLETIGLWVSSGQARNIMGRRKCVKVVKEFQERLADVLERFELASLLRSYTVFPFIKKMIEDYAVTLDAGAATLHSSTNADDLPKSSPGSGIVEQGNPNPDPKQQKYQMEKETHDALRVKIQLILRIIEKEERNQHSSRDKSAPVDQIASGSNPYPQDFEKERQVSRPDQLQDSQGKLVPEADNMSADHDNMERDAVELLYDMLMARLSSVAIPEPKLLSPSSFPLPSRPTPGYTSTRSLSQSTPTEQIPPEKSLPSLELVGPSKSREHHGYILQAQEVEHAYGQSKPFNHVKQGIQLRGSASLPPGAMAPFVSTVSLVSLLNGRTSSRSLTSVSIRPERSLSITPLPDIEEEVERAEIPKTLGSPTEEERKPIAPPLPLGVQESVRPSRPSISDLDQGRPTNPNQQALVIPPVSMPNPEDTGKDKPSTEALNATRSTGASMPLLSASTHTSSIRIPSDPPQTLNATQLADALPGSTPFLVSPTSPVAINMPNGSPPLPPGAMPPKLKSWLPPSFGKEEPVPQGHHPTGPGPTLNPVPFPSPFADEKLPPSMQSNSSTSRQPELTLNRSSLQTTNSGPENKEEPLNYHLPPITMPSPLSLGPLMVVDSPSSHTALLSLPPIKRPEHIGPGEHLRKMSPHMQRYVGRLADRIWGGSEGGG